jgi:hypothetical protein
MSTEMPGVPSDIELLHTYLGQRIQDNSGELSLDSALSGFQEYYDQLRELRGMVRQAEQSLSRGEGRALDVESVIGRVRQRLAEQGAND